jgi:outer membrane receptor for monomeric catechols
MKATLRFPTRAKSPAAQAMIVALAFLPALAIGQTAADSSGSSAPKKIDDDKLVLSEFVVTGSKDEGYRSAQTVSGSRTVENLRNTPNSISIMNRELIDDLGAGSVAEVMKYAIAGELSALSQAPTPGNASGATTPFYEFRGLTSQYPLRDGILWRSPLDTYNIERVEVLRGPNAFLYGEGGASGSINQLTKKPVPKDFTRVSVRAGSDGLLRGELDVNRMLTKDFGLRLNVAQQDQGSPTHFVERDFKGATLTGLWRPLRNTTIYTTLEIGRSHQNLQPAVLADGYSLTDTRGALGAVRSSDQTAGLTYLSASGVMINSIGERLSTGTSNPLIIVPSSLIPNASSIYPRETNFSGPGTFYDVRYDSMMFDIEQKVGSNLTIQGTLHQFDMIRDTLYANSTLSGGVFRDLNPTRADGSANPYFNKLYTEYYFTRRIINEPRRMARLTAVYNLVLPFMTQKIVAQGAYNDDSVEGKFYTEFVDPSNPNFKGTLVNATTKAQADANAQVWRRNHLYRRQYLQDGDSARYTAFDPVPGVSTFRRTGLDTETDGDSGRFFTADYRFYQPGYGIGASGTYLKGKVNSLVGWRRDGFRSARTLDYYNDTLGQDVVTTPGAPKTIVAPVSKDSYNYGVVVHPASFVSIYANYAQSVSISNSPIGSPSFRTGVLRELGQGAGTEFGLRWSLLGGRLESNWTAYRTSNVKTFGSPGPNAAQLAELSAIFGSQFITGGSDTHDETATGLEFETVANITKNWRLIWNFATNKLNLTNRYPTLHAFQAEAKALGAPTPLLDALLAANPDGTPRAGFYKERSNLVTNYTIRSGPLRNLSVGGGIQYRARSYLGRIDLDADGTSKDEYAPSYTVCDLTLGYSAKLMGREVRYQLNVMNLFDRDYYRAYGANSVAFGEPMTWRLTATTTF